MKLAFIILAHKYPAQLQRLLQRLAHPQIDCYVHLDAKCDLSEWQQVLDMEQVHLVEKRLSITWAGWGIAEATLNAMEQTLTSPEPYHYVTLLSGQDYPLKTAAEIHAFFARYNHTQFLDFLSREVQQPMMTKMDQYHFVEFNVKGKHLLNKILTRLLPKRKAPLGLELVCGSQWWSLTADCVKFCVEYEKKYPALRRFFRLSWGPDEWLFQTIIMNSPYKQEVSGHNLHFMDWSAGKEHPKTFGMEDFSHIAGSDLLFARKFDMVQTPALLDKIDQELLSPATLSDNSKG